MCNILTLRETKIGPLFKRTTCQEVTRICVVQDDVGGSVYLQSSENDKDDKDTQRQQRPHQ